MSNFITLSGKEIDYLNPDISQIDIEDIALGLARTSKFVGQTSTVYTNAQHCLNLVKLVPQELKLQALLHDAAEYCCSDLATPIKYTGHLDVYKLIEKWISSLILVKYTGMSVYHKDIKFYDRCLFYIEAYNLHAQLFRSAANSFQADTLMSASYINADVLVDVFKNRFTDLDFSVKSADEIKNEYLNVFNHLYST